MNILSIDKTNETAKIKLHGTNGWFETKNGKTSCIGVYTENYVVLFDIGTGFSNVNPKETKNKPLYLFLSHLHFDHIYGLHLLSIHSPSRMKIFIPSELKRHFITISKEPFIKSLDDLGFPINICGLSTKWYHEEFFNFQALDLVHNTTTFCYRLELMNKTISYCVDTKLCENVFKISKNADVFICDSALKQNDKIEGKFHMRINDAFRVASESNVGLLILTHFGALRYRSVKERNEEAQTLNHTFKKYMVGFDGIQIKL